MQAPPNVQSPEPLAQGGNGALKMDRLGSAISFPIKPSRTEGQLHGAVASLDGPSGELASIAEWHVAISSVEDLHALRSP